MVFPPATAASVAAAALEFIKTTQVGSGLGLGSGAIPDDFHHLIGGNNLDGVVVSNCYHPSMSLGPPPAATSGGGQRTTSLPGPVPSPCPSRTNSPPELAFEASGGPISANEIVKRDFDEATDSGAAGRDALTRVVEMPFSGGRTSAAAVVDNYLDNFQSNFPSLDALFLGELNAVQSATVDDRDRADRDQKPGLDGSIIGGSTCFQKGSAGGFRASKSNSGGGLRSSSFTIESIMRK